MYTTTRSTRTVSRIALNSNTSHGNCSGVGVGLTHGPQLRLSYLIDHSAKLLHVVPKNAFALPICCPKLEQCLPVDVLEDRGGRLVSIRNV